MRTRLTLTSVTKANPVSIAEVRLYSRIPNISAEDALIQQQIDGAVTWIEQYIGKAINVNTQTLQVWNFADERDLEGTTLYLDLVGPVRSITSVKAYSEDNTETTLVADTDYYLLKGDRLRILSAGTYDSLEVVYVSGMQTVEITNNIKEAIYKLVDELYKHKGISVTGTIVANLKANLSSLLNRERTKLNW
jgi:uncharacterized phiE125 gp8 family phage protein